MELGVIDYIHMDSNHGVLIWKHALIILEANWKQAHMLPIFYSKALFLMSANSCPVFVVLITLDLYVFGYSINQKIYIRLKDILYKINNMILGEI